MLAKEEETSLLIWWLTIRHESLSTNKEKNVLQVEGTTTDMDLSRVLTCPLQFVLYQPANSNVCLVMSVFAFPVSCFAYLRVFFAYLSEIAVLNKAHFWPQLKKEINWNINLDNYQCFCIITFICILFYLTCKTSWSKFLPRTWKLPMTKMELLPSWDEIMLRLENDVVKATFKSKKRYLLCIVFGWQPSKDCKTKISELALKWNPFNRRKRILMNSCLL